MAKTSKMANGTPATSTTAAKASSGHELADEIDRLGTMRINELQQLYAEVTGKSTRCPNRTWLVKAILEVALPAQAVVPTQAEASPQPEEATPAVDEGEPSGGLEVDPIGPANGPEPSAPVAGLDNAAALAAGAHMPTDGAGAALLPTAAVNLSKLGIPELQALYSEVLGRPTASTSRNYLVYKVRAAQKGTVSAGSRTRHQKTGDAIMVLPLRMEADMVDQLDAAWRRQGLRSRMDLIRRSLSSYLASVGEGEVAALLGSDA